MKLIFMGTPEFAVPCLERVLADGHEVALVITQPDKPKGRGYELTPPPVKLCAQQNGLEIYQPVSLKDNVQAISMMEQCGADAAVVVAYGKILPRALLEAPRLGCVNVHASLLPKYRGAAPIQYAVLNGDSSTGVTTMLLDEGMDTGDILLSKAVDIPYDMTAGELHDLLMEPGAQILSETLRSLEAGTLISVPQDNSTASYAPMLTRNMSRIDWNQTAGALRNLVRGLNPWPSAYTECGGKLLKIHQALEIDASIDALPGTISSISPFSVVCGEGTALELVEVQPEGGKRMTGADFTRGRRLSVGETV